MFYLSIPSPSTGVWNLGPVPLRAYAFFIIIGILVAIYLGEKRWIARGGKVNQVSDIAMWAVPFGIIGGRVYHVLTDYEKYFGSDKNWVDALRIWNGGLGIWGAISIGALGAWIGCRRNYVLLPPFADAIAPGIIFAQAIGRLGNYFNQELFGRPTEVSWALEISERYRPVGYENFSTFHPTFLYEMIWNIAIGFLIIYLDRKYKMGHGRVFASYVALYSLGRLFVENLRIDEARLLFGLRFNITTSVLVILGGIIYIGVSSKLKPGREVKVKR